MHIIIHRIQDVFYSFRILYLLQYESSVSTHDFQHKTKNCQTQCSLSRVENHEEVTKNHFDENEMSDLCGMTLCAR